MDRVAVSTVSIERYALIGLKYNLSGLLASGSYESGFDQYAYKTVYSREVGQ